MGVWGKVSRSWRAMKATVLEAKAEYSAAVAEGARVWKRQSKTWAMRSPETVTRMRVRLQLSSGVETGLEQLGGRIDALGAAGLLELGEVHCLGGRGRAVENGCPAGCGRGAEGGELRGVVEGIEVDIGEQERGHGVRGLRGRLGLRGKGDDREQGKERQEVKGLHGK